MSVNSRRHGEIVGFWGTLDSNDNPVAVAVQAGASSQAQYIGQNVDQFSFLVSVDAATSITLYAAHSSELNSEGNNPDRSVSPPISLFYPVYWNTTQIKLTFSGAGTAYVMVPDFVAGWVLLKSSGAANIYAGYEAVAL